MTTSPATYAELETRVSAWAQARPDVHGVVVVGSRARQDHPADERSDLDLILFAEDSAAYQGDARWLDELGRVWVAILGQTGRGDPEWLVLFDGGLKADFVLVSLDKTPGSSLQAWLAATPYGFVLTRGVRTLVDKGQPPSPHPGGFQGPTLAHPPPEQFSTLVQRVWLDAGRTAQFLARGDLWRAKHLCDGVLKQCGLTLLEWHARAVHGLDYDTWHDGRYLEEWADPRALAALPATFARYDRDDLWRALGATLSLLRWLAQETADRLGYPYPTQMDAQVSAWLERVYNGTEDSHG